MVRVFAFNKRTFCREQKIPLKYGKVMFFNKLRKQENVLYAFNRKEEVSIFMLQRCETEIYGLISVCI